MGCGTSTGTNSSIRINVIEATSIAIDYSQLSLKAVDEQHPASPGRLSTPKRTPTDASTSGSRKKRV